MANAEQPIVYFNKIVCEKVLYEVFAKIFSERQLKPDFVKDINIQLMRGIIKNNRKLNIKNPLSDEFLTALSIEVTRKMQSLFVSTLKDYRNLFDNKKN